MILGFPLETTKSLIVAIFGFVVSVIIGLVMGAYFYHVDKHIEFFDNILKESELNFSEKPKVLVWRDEASGPFLSNQYLVVVFTISEEDLEKFTSCDMPGYEMRLSILEDSSKSRSNKRLRCTKADIAFPRRYMSEFQIRDNMLVFTNIVM